MELTLIAHKIYMIRGSKVMLDFDLANLYGVETRTLKQAVRRNTERFPSDFMFELTKEELSYLTSQVVTSSLHGGLRHLPFAFTEQGVAMLSSVLKSDKAINVNIAIIRAFVLLREYLAENKELSQRMTVIEGQIGEIIHSISYLLEKDSVE